MQPSFSPVQLLTDLGLGTYSAAVVSLLGFLGFLLAHTMPFIPQPSSNTNGFLTFLWKVANAASGGYGQAKPSSTVLPPETPATPSQVPPQSIT